MFDEIHRDDLIAIFTALLNEENVEQPEWWGPHTRVEFNGLTAACAARHSGPGRIMLYPFKGTREEALARPSGGFKVTVWEDPL